MTTDGWLFGEASGKSGDTVPKSHSCKSTIFWRRDPIPFFYSFLKDSLSFVRPLWAQPDRHRALNTLQSSTEGQSYEIELSSTEHNFDFLMAGPLRKGCLTPPPTGHWIVAKETFDYAIGRLSRTYPNDAPKCGNHGQPMPWKIELVHRL
jgi:hypothetical protein